MFDWIKRLFGEGVVRVEFTATDGRRGTANVPYIGEYDESEVIAIIKSRLLVDHGVAVRSVNIISHYEK